MINAKLTLILLGLIIPIVGIASDAKSDNKLPTSYQGLPLVENTRMGAVYAKPGVNLATYEKVMLNLVEVKFADVPSDTKNQLTANERKKLDRLFKEAFERELRKSGYALTETPADKVLKVDAAILDLYINAPRHNVSGRSYVFARNTVKMALAVELSDSLSNEILARAVDRRRSRDWPNARRMTSLDYWNDATRAFEYWAGILRDAMDEVREQK